MKWYVVEVKHDGPVLETSVLLGPFRNRRSAVARLGDYYGEHFKDDEDVDFDMVSAKITMDEGQYIRTILVSKGYNDEERQA